MLPGTASDRPTQTWAGAALQGSPPKNPKSGRPVGPAPDTLKAAGAVMRLWSGASGCEQRIPLPHDPTRSIELFDEITDQEPKEFDARRCDRAPGIDRDAGS
jgi:hypothetical protein